MSLYVGNLHPECNEAILYKKFSLIGKVSSVKICRDSATSKSLGYGYVNYHDKDDAKKAMDAMNYDSVLGQAMRIMWANMKPSQLSGKANIVVKNLTTSEDEVFLKDLFSPFGEILSLKVARNSQGEAKGYGFIQFAQDQEAELAISSINGTQFNGRKLFVSRFIPAEERRRFQQESFPNNVYVSNLNTTSDREFVEICEPFGDVVSAKIARDPSNKSRGFGFVSFKEAEAAERAVKELNRLCLNGRRVTACFVKKKQVVEA